MLRGHVRSSPPTGARHVVAMLATPAASIVELVTPAEVLTTGRALGRYEVRICAVEPGRVELMSGFSVEAPHGLDALAGADTVIVPGTPEPPLDPSPTLVHALRGAAARGARIVATGSGVFVLAAAGLLAGRTVTTRPDLADDLRRQFPQVHVDTLVSVTADSGIHTCAGGVSTLDMCLELARQDSEPEPAHNLAELLEWATARLDEQLSLPDLARAARVSSRTLARWFEAAFGTTPMQWLLAQRLHRAQYLLRTTSEPIERITRLTGFGSTSNFRLQFTRATTMSPQAYRRAAREAGRERPIHIREPAIAAHVAAGTSRRDAAADELVLSGTPAQALRQEPGAVDSQEHKLPHRTGARSLHAEKRGHN